MSVFYWSFWEDVDLLVCICPGSPGQKHMGICQKQKSSTCSRCGGGQCLSEEQVCHIPKQLSLCFVIYLETPTWDHEFLNAPSTKFLFTKRMLCVGICRKMVVLRWISCTQNESTVSSLSLIKLPGFVWVCLVFFGVCLVLCFCFLVLFPFWCFGISFTSFKH